MGYHLKSVGKVNSQDVAPVSVVGLHLSHLLKNVSHTSQVFYKEIG